MRNSFPGLRPNQDSLTSAGAILGEEVNPDEDVRKRQLELLESHFIIGSLDAHAASLVAEIECNKNLLRNIKRKYDKDRQTIKVDVQIIAIATAKSADLLVSNDEGLRRMAEGYVKAIAIPTIDEQLDLPLNYDSE